MTFIANTSARKDFDCYLWLRAGRNMGRYHFTKRCKGWCLYPSKYWYKLWYNIGLYQAKSLLQAQ